MWILLVAGLLAACSFAAPAPTLPPAFLPPATSLPTGTSAANPTATPSLPPTATPPPTPTETQIPPALNAIRFAVIGDYGMAGSGVEAVATLVSNWQPDFIVTTGDNNYPTGAAETIDANVGAYFHAYIAPYTGAYGPGASENRFWPVLGNHDWDTPNAQPYLDYFTLPGNERYYDFTAGPVHFFMLDSDSRELDGVGASSLQAQWLQAGLAASPSPWNVAVIHHPPYSSSTHGSTAWMQWPFEAWGADLILSGHNHVYERIQRGGLPYITNGLGGSLHRYYFLQTVEGSVARFRDLQGALFVQASETDFSAEFVTIAGEVVDAFSLGDAETRGSPALPSGVTAFPQAARYLWEPFASGFDQPLFVTTAGDGRGRLFVVEQPGVIRILQGTETLPEPFLDIRALVGSEGNEQGLLGLAFHPEFAANGFFYVDYTDKRGDTVVARYQASPTDPNRAGPATALTLLAVPQPYENHNGGHLVFGPDGFLYVGLGDGGAGGDPQGNGQNPHTLLGAILRLDVDAPPPYLPPDNPFGAGGGRPEIWAYGLRNPWRFSFDRLTGGLWIGDVGQDVWEEIDFLPPGSPGGENFGWNAFEGSHPFEGSAPAGAAFVSPVWEYSHREGGCSVTGGVVYRGAALPDFYGVYLFSDYCSGKVWGLLPGEGGAWQHTELFDLEALVTSFGEDEAGEVLLVSRQGTLYRLVQTGR